MCARQETEATGSKSESIGPFKDRHASAESEDGEYEVNNRVGIHHLLKVGRVLALLCFCILFKDAESGTAFIVVRVFGLYVCGRVRLRFNKSFSLSFELVTDKLVVF